MQTSYKQGTGVYTSEMLCFAFQMNMCYSHNTYYYNIYWYFLYLQILPILKFIRSYIEENPLICCYDEISALKKLVGNKDELKLKQKNSSITLTLHQDLYYFKTRLEVPDNYPISCVVYVWICKIIVKQIAVQCSLFKFNICRLSDVDTNFPPLFKRYLIGQGKEFARQCVESPLKKTAAQQKPFAPLPSLNKVTSFLIK